MSSILIIDRQRRIQKATVNSVGMARILFVFVCVILVSLLFSLPPVAAAPKKNTYTVAIVPQFPASIIKRDWMPLIEKISRVSKVRLELKFYRSIPEFEEEFLKGTPDFVYLNPYHAVMARKARGYIPLIRDGENQLFGILVVRGDAELTHIRDLDGQDIAFPSPNSFAASLYMRALLTNHEKIRFTPRYLTTHSNVYRHVVLGKAAAGGGVNKTLNKESPQLKGLLREIYRTPAVAPHPVCAHPRVAPAVRDAVATAILKLGEEEAGRRLLKSVEIDRPVLADYQRDYRMLEQPGLERFIVKGGN